MRGRELKVEKLLKYPDNPFILMKLDPFMGTCKATGPHRAAAAAVSMTSLAKAFLIEVFAFKSRARTRIRIKRLYCYRQPKTTSSGDEVSNYRRGL